MVAAGDLGRYELLIELGRGGMAELFVGRLRGAGGFAKLVAIKRILPHLAQDRQFTEMFLDEARIASRLSHPNVCQVFELGSEQGQLFLVMEYLDGASWDHLLDAGRPDARLVAGVLAQAAEGLHHAHTLQDLTGRPTPIVHRDVSPQNLFVTVDGVCKVLDFGVSKMMTDGPRTRTGVLKGKLPYMSPEQIRGDALDPRADVFALGVCTWEALAGARLFDRDTDFQIWKAVTETDAPRLTACPAAVADVVARALDRERERRQASARVFADELRLAAGFASAAEIAQAVRAACADRIAARARRVAEAVGQRGEPESAPSGPITNAAVTVDLAAQPAPAGVGEEPAQPAPAGVRLRDESLVVERAVSSVDRPAAVMAAVPSSVARSPTSTGELAHAVAPSSIGHASSIAPSSVGYGNPSAHAQAPPSPISQASSSGERVSVGSNRIAASSDRVARSAALANAGPPMAPKRGARTTVVVVIAASLAAALAVVVMVVMTRGSSQRETVTPDAAPDRVERPFEELRQNLEHLRDTLAPLRDLGKRRSANAPTGTYVVESQPPARIFDGDTLLGQTPLRVELSAGRHDLRAVLEDGREQTYDVEITAGETTTAPLSW